VATIARAGAAEVLEVIMIGTEYIERRLDRLSGKAVQDAIVDVIQLQSLTAATTGLGGNRKYILHYQAVGVDLETLLQRMAADIHAYASLGKDVLAATLQHAGDKYVDDIVKWLQLHSKYDAPFHYRNGGPFGDIGPPSKPLERRLRKMVTQAVDDFLHGRVRKGPLVKDANTKPDLINSPGRVLQYVAGSHTQLSVKLNGVVNALEAVLASNEVARLPEAARVKVQNYAEIVKGEALKPADQSKLAWWGGELVKCLRDVGVGLGAAVIAKVIGAA
jgi:hypothetical protein